MCVLNLYRRISSFVDVDYLQLGETDFDQYTLGTLHSSGPRPSYGQSLHAPLQHCLRPQLMIFHEHGDSGSIIYIPMEKGALYNMVMLISTDSLIIVNGFGTYTGADFVTNSTIEKPRKCFQ